MWLALSGCSGRGRKDRAALNVNEASLKHDRASISVACVPGDLSSLLETQASFLGAEVGVGTKGSWSGRVE